MARTRPPPAPDLLSAEAKVRIDAAELRQTLVFAFAIGGSVDAFDAILARAQLPPSAWDRAHFARDVFLDDLVARAFRIQIGGRSFAPCVAYLARVVGEPPRDPAESAFRREVLGELAAGPDLLHDLQGAYSAIVRLRALLCAGRDGSPRLRRLDILRAIRSVVDELADGFEGAESGLARLSTFGRWVRESPAYARLDALLDHEEHLATLDLRIRVGADGELSNFQVVAVRENQGNAFHSTAIGRWLTRLVMYLRGYRLSSGEVIENLFENVFSGLEDSLVLIFQLLGDLEFYLAALGLASRARAKGLSMCFPDLEGEASGVDLTGLWNPLLFDDRVPPVPCDLSTNHDDAVVIVTGPNSGGKTRLLQTIAIAQMFGEAGMFVPARTARLGRVSGLFVSLLDEARSDQPEGQLGMELLRIRRLFEELSVGSLVLLDELCSGTNPSEGEEIAELVLSLLPEIKARAFVTTHLLSFAARLAERRPVPHLEFVQVDLDATDRPTFRFRPGVAKTSLAKQTAARLGVTRDELLALIAQKKRAAAEAADPPASSRKPSAVAAEE